MENILELVLIANITIPAVLIYINKDVIHITKMINSIQ